MSDIEVTGLEKTFTRGGETLRVLDGLDLAVPDGGFVALMGPSGSGKTTLLNMMGALDRPDAGTIRMGDDVITSMPAGDLPQWRADHVGFVFQAFNLVPVLTALQNVMLPLQLAPLSRAERREHARFAMEVVGLTDRMDHRPSQLSGGQEQRVAIARAIATDPDIVLADEPTGDLDRQNADAIMDLLERINQELGTTIVVVTHDEVVGRRVKRLVRLDKGRLAEDSDAAATSG